MVDQANSRPQGSFLFGPFRLTQSERLLENGNAPVPIGGRSLDILIVLVERVGEIVSKDELIARVWPDVTVDEGSLRFHIAALRKSLGDGKSGARYVTNVAGRGYCFVAPVSRAPPRTPAAGGGSAPDKVYNLPAHLARMVGRDAVVRSIATHLTTERFLTIVGPGGIGKTTVAIAVAHALLTEFDGAVHFLDLGSMGDPRLVASNLASTLRLPVSSDNAVPTVIDYLRDRRGLLVFDSCEHVIDAVAALGETLFMEAPRIHILATSRESLRVEGEHVHRLFPQDYPPDDAGLTAAEALGFPAIQLFVGRVAATAYAFVLSDSDARIAAEICRKLDGIALAIELAAGRVAAHGVAGTAALLRDRFSLLWQGRRTAAPRHQTLTATLDWSYHFLSEGERLTLCRLSVFAGPFTLDAARSVAAEDGGAVAFIVETLAALVEKSLVSASSIGERTVYRLLDTTRAYAKGKLANRGEGELAARRHAKYYLAYFGAAETDLNIIPAEDWRARYYPCLENVRAALDWSFSNSGDASIGVALAIASIPLWFELSLMEECRQRAEQALARLQDASIDRAEAEMRLLAALGTSLQGRWEDLDQTWTRLGEIAESLGNSDFQIRALWGRWVTSITRWDKNALPVAQKLYSVAKYSGDPSDIAMAERLLGTSLHWCGDQANARLHFERMLASKPSTARRSQRIRFQFDQRIASRAYLARTYCLQGLPDTAMSAARTSVEEAQNLDHNLSLCQALGHAGCPIPLIIGDLAAADYFVAMQLKHAPRESFPAFYMAARSFLATLQIERGDLEDGLSLLQTVLDEIHRAKANIYNPSKMGTLAEALGRTGRTAAGLAAVEQALVHSYDSDELWSAPELLRIKGELTLQQGDSVGAEQCFENSLDLAALQGALWWQLRTSTSLATMLRGQERPGEALDILGAVYERFTEGFETPHLRVAKTLIDHIRNEA
jgi:predicted ATPase/DNA-binding winged helix-turn-helix (wHTH) protein